MSDPLILCIQSYPHWGIANIAIDIGANVGDYSRIMVETKINPNDTSPHAQNMFQRVLSVEPHPNNIKKFQEKNLRAELHQVVIGKTNGLVKLFNNSNPGGHSISEALLGGPWGHKDNEFMFVNSLTLDEFDQRYIGDGKIGFMKVDIEGAEDFIFDYGKGLLQRNRDWLWIDLELHQTVDRKRLRELFLDLGYVFYDHQRYDQEVKGNLIWDTHYLIKAKSTSE